MEGPSPPATCGGPQDLDTLASSQPLEGKESTTNMLSDSVFDRNQLFITNFGCPCFFSGCKLHVSVASETVKHKIPNRGRRLLAAVFEGQNKPKKTGIPL